MQAYDDCAPVIDETTDNSEQGISHRFKTTRNPEFKANKNNALLKGIYSSDVMPSDQQMNIVCAFICQNCF